MTSCKLRVKLRVTFSELFVEEYRKNRLMGRSVSPTHKFLHIQQQKEVKCQVSVKFVSDFISFSVKLVSMS